MRKYMLGVVIIWACLLSGYRSCMNKERLALTDINSFFKSNNGIKINDLFSSWDNSNRESLDCCNWDRVECNKTTGRVVKIFLNNTNNVQVYDSSILDKVWFLNASLFLPFDELIHLDLSRNWFSGCYDGHGFERFTSLKKLEFLNLESNKFENNILSDLGALKSLKNLDLYFNRFEGSSPAKELATLPKLETLNLSGNYDGVSQKLQGFEVLSELKSLVNLRLDSIGLENNHLSSLSAITSLKTLNLWGNNLEGPFPYKELSALEDLEMLDLSGNALSKPPEFQGVNKLKKLVKLELSFNKFDKTILPFLNSLSSIQYLDLTGNNLGPFFPARELASLEKLEELYLSANELNDSSVFQELALLKNLKILDLSVNKLKTIHSPESISLEKLEELYLGGNQLNDSSAFKELTLLKNLKILDLSENNLKIIYSPESISLEKLEVLFLAYNQLNDSSAFKELALLKNLKVLDLSFNMLNETIHSSDLGCLEKLEVLNLGFNKLKDASILKEITSLKKLEVLDLSSNTLSGEVSASIGNLMSLKVLSLANNQLNGSLPEQALCKLSKLEELDISRNDLNGVVPICLGSLTSLRLLGISSNKLQGDVNLIPLTSLKSLEYIDLTDNLFEGLFSFSSIANHSNLKVVALECDNKIEVETESSSWVPRFQLNTIVIPNCNLNKHSNYIPSFLRHQFELEEVDLSHNGLTGQFPTWLLENNNNLGFLSLRNNSFSGQFHLPQNLSINIWQIDISDNHFHGKLQDSLGSIYLLNLSGNSFDGSLPSSFSNTFQLLRFLDLSRNNLSGEVPENFVKNCSDLYYLNLSKNKLHGRMPNFNMTHLRNLQLSENQFTGVLPSGASYSNLFFLDISGNHMSGKITGFLSNMTCSVLSMRDNAFEGEIPCGSHSIEFLDLSYNSLSGPLPSCLELSKLKHLNLEGNELSGSIPANWFNSSNALQTFNLKNNHLSGLIPTSIGAMTGLRALLLQDNLLSSSIPNQICLLSEMSILDLSYNLFSGPIPRCFGNISFGNIQAKDFDFTGPFYFNFSGFTMYPFWWEHRGYDNFEPRRQELVGQVQVEFATKKRSDIYKGKILGLMSGLDLSCNHLTGEIPPELGKLSEIHALNLSHNQLTGSIPRTFSNLSEIESLDLSYNNLTGPIPSEMTSLYRLEVFSVAYNNLSGRVPDAKGQFGTFDNSSYEGNPLLCGPPLAKSCNVAPGIEPHSSPTDSDSVVLCASFFASYVMFLVGTLAVLYINQYWRQRWFNFADDVIDSCAFYLSRFFRKLLAKLRIR